MRKLEQKKCKLSIFMLGFDEKKDTWFEFVSIEKSRKFDNVAKEIGIGAIWKNLVQLRKFSRALAFVLRRKLQKNSYWIIQN